MKHSFKTAAAFSAICCAVSFGLLLPAPVSAQQRVERGPDIHRTAPVQIKLDSIATNALVVMLMRDVMGVPYVISPDVLKDARPVSVNLSIPRRDLPVRVVQFLRSLGMTVTLRGGTVYVTKSELAGGSSPLGPLGPDVPASPVGAGFAPVPSGSPLDPSYRSDPVGSGASNIVAGSPQQMESSAEPPALLGYIPGNRDPAYLAAVLEPLFPSVTFGARLEAQASSQSQAIYGSELSDVLLMTGPVDELERVKLAIGALDRPRPLVSVKAVVMQVANVEARGSALSLLASVAGGRLEVGSFGDAPGSQFVRLSVGALQAVMSAVREDSRFQVVASPNLSALSGAVATINAGSQVPTLGAVTVSEGTATQSVVYRDSGITLEVRPVVRGGLIHLDVRQERSNFVPTSTGVDDSPTLQTASVSAQALLRPGESMALAGLTEDSTGNRREGIFGGLLGVRSRDKNESELLVMLQADLVAVGPSLPGLFLDLEPKTEADLEGETDAV